jgi:spermidine synthase
MSAALLLQPELKSLLVLGMGSGSGGVFLQQRLPELTVDYVELDPAVAEVAREYLFFDDGPFEDGTHRQVHIDDARRYLSTHPDDRWDYIYADTYIGQSIPFHLATVELYREVQTHLNPGGVFGLNMTTQLENPFARAMLRSLGAVFAHIYIFNIPGGNYLFLVTDQPDAPDRQQLLDRARELDQRWSFDPTLTQLAKRLRQVDVDLTDALYLTDQFAPVNHLIRIDRDLERWRVESEGE